MTRNHYNLIIKGIHGMIDQMMQPYLGETVTVRLSAQIADEYDAFITALREVSNALKTDAQLCVEDEDELFEVDDELDDLFAALTESDETPESLTLAIHTAQEQTDRSEYEAFVKNLRNRKCDE